MLFLERVRLFPRSQVMVVDRVAVALQQVLGLQTIGAEVIIHDHAVERGGFGFFGHWCLHDLVSRTGKVRNQGIHFVDFTTLGFNDLRGQLLHPGIGNLGTFARQDRDRMVRDHRAHPAHVLHCLLAAHEPERACEDHDGAQIDRRVHCLVAVHAKHEGQHHHGHHRAHHEGHVESRFTEKDVIKGIGVEVHQTEHHRGRCADHCKEAAVGL
mmetsp:Transcript_1309/g.2627  ORF Transcript_1309/g.2627 Transcript_1309/m.2627 type:complete len:212 (+) Transcript_1309:2312-2947(+)